mmetsp:Transcript_6827/g.14594  ORF Transcript_6827/g.14594 Transcript_6827/m.14594 type:complete len:216 (+) Transcript_6827:848-1495(+)
MLAPSTISLEEGVPSSRRKFFQLAELMVFGRPPAGTNASALIRKGIEFLRAMPSSLSLALNMTPSADNFLRSKCTMDLPFFTRRSSSDGSRPWGSSATPSTSEMPTILALVPYSLKRILMRFPATSPSGPPVTFTVKGWLLGSMLSISLRATSKNTTTPSLVTPNSLWLKPASILLDMKAAGMLYPRTAARATIQSMSAAITCSSGPRKTTSSCP